MNFLPAALSQDNFREFFEEHFVWVGLVENLEETIPVLAERLGFAAIPLERLNASAHSRPSLTATNTAAAPMVEKRYFAFFPPLSPATTVS